MISKRSNWICQWKVSGSLFCRNRLHENCLHQWWNKNQYHFTDMNARWTDFIQMQCKETGFFEMKSTNFIHRQPSEIFVNDQTVLKIDIIWKEPNSQSYLEKRSWKNLCWYVLLITSFRWRLLYENRWESTKRKRQLFGSAWKSIFSKRNSVRETNVQVKIQENYFKDKKRKKKLKSWKVKGSETKFNEGKNTLT